MHKQRLPLSSTLCSAYGLCYCVGVQITHTTLFTPLSYPNYPKNNVVPSKLNPRSSVDWELVLLVGEPLAVCDVVDGADEAELELEVTVYAVHKCDANGTGID